MDTFSTDGLPPLPEDDNRRAAWWESLRGLGPSHPNSVCKSVGCRRPAVRGLPYCTVCFGRLGEAANFPEEPLTTLPPARTPQEQREEAELLDEEIKQAAPPFAWAWLEYGCVWCDRIRNEHVQAPGAVRRLNGRDRSEDHVCARHQLRRAAHREILAKFHWHRANGWSDARIASHYWHGYLGDLLNDDQRF